MRGCLDVVYSRVFRVALFLGTSGALAAQTPAKVDFARDVQPILRDHCYECHGASQQMRGLRLDRRRDAMPNRVGANRPRIVPGDSAKSPLYLRVSGSQSGAQMPPAGSLRPEQIAIVRTWIDQGAEWPDAVSGDKSGARPDPAVVTMMTALRDGKRAEFERRLRSAPAALNAKGPDGWTPLMYAALYGDPQAVRLLLDRGANPDAQNEDGGSALMYAVDDPGKTQLLLERGANPNLRSGEGRTALLIAAAAGIDSTVKLLLDKGADVNVPLADGRGVLALAAGAGNPGLLKLLLDRGASKASLPIGTAIGRRCSACVDLLLELAKPADLTAALPAAVGVGDLPLVQKLLDRDARANPNLLAFAALSPAAFPPELTKTLIARGADRNIKSPSGLTVLELARRQGKLSLVKELSEAGVTDDGPAPALLRPKPAASVRAAIERSIPALQRADVAFLDKAGCVSCHNNSLTAMTVAAARTARLAFDERIAKDQLRRIAAFLQENRERALELVGLPGDIDTVSYILLGMAAERYPGDALTDAWARFLKLRQSPDGAWRILTNRPPLESSDFQVTASSIRSLRSFGPAARRAEYDQAVARAVRWLEQAQPNSHEDRAYKLLGLIWGAGSRTAIKETAQQLLASQKPDGGWAQLETLPSDAYATGQALVALRDSGHPMGHPAIKRGIRYLLESQMEDGSWYVRTRTIPIQPYFDSAYPHGPDQFISAAAANWATMALISAVR
jgi:ankyrin repeat protein